MKNLLLITVFFLFGAISYSQGLTIIEQDFKKASELAQKENKLLFIDFYTTWCGPCKKLDKLVFRNKSVQKKLGKDFILLRYDAENDSIYNISKKHHVNSYPTGIVLNQQRFVLNREYGFSGEDFDGLSKSVFDFTTQTLELNNGNKILKGYSNKIEISKYPKFYIDFVNRVDTKVTRTEEFKSFWNKKQNIFSEEYFSPLVYFAKDLPVTIADDFLKNKEKYIDLFGKTDVSVALLFLSVGKFDSAIANKSQTQFDQAIEFSEKALEEKSAKQISVLFKKKFTESKKE